MSNQLLISLLLITVCTCQLINFPTEYYPQPASTTPRLWIKNDLERIKLAYNDTTNLGATTFKKEIGKMMKFATASGDWRYKSGWPAAALALAYRITGNITYGLKAITTYIPYFNGVPIVSGRLQSIQHYCLAYDWLQGHPNFTDTFKKDLETKFNSWSDSEWASDTTKSSYIAQDSDHLTASTTSHFICGVALYGDNNETAIKLMDRGWTGVVKGYNNNSGLPYVSIEDMFSTTKNGIPLPGWDYNWMSDMWDLQNLIYVLDELGYVSNFTRNWWPNTIQTFINNIDPNNTHYRWIGDTQSEVFLYSFSGYIWSWYSNAIFMAERYGFKTIAAQGRSFLDQLRPGQWGPSEGDPMLWMVRGYGKNEPRLNYTLANATELVPRYLVYEGLGQDQRNGYGFFRTSWLPNATWGGFAGIGNYLVDHMHAIHGSYFLWRNGEYLTTDPHNYGGETALPLYNNLGISNPKQYEQGGPIFYYQKYPAFLERGRISWNGLAQHPNDFLYAMVNCNGSYNQPDKKWDPSQPVLFYHRHFLYDGGDFVLLIDKVVMNKTQNVTTWRYRTQNATVAPTLVGTNLISAPSDKGTYRALIKIFEPSTINWSFLNETAVFGPKVGKWQVDPRMWGFMITGIDSNLTSHVWVSAINIGFANSTNTEFDNSGQISSTTLLGLYAGNTVLAVHKNTTLISSAEYSTPDTTQPNARHVVGDLEVGCYSVTASVDGALGNFQASTKDNTILFNSLSSGNQTFTIASVPC